jgi:sigma-B regulation protein RsbU (phosphoserine phosphatase)
VDYVTKPFQAAEVLARVATHLALRALQKQLQEANETMAQELTLAGEIQASFLPSDLPSLPGWQVSATLQPARQVSGDFYDFLPLPSGRLGIVVADVTDKGAGAALYMALSCTLMRTYAEQDPAHPDLVLAAVNRRILKDTSAQEFVTLFYAVLEPATGVLAYSNAGHCPPLHFYAARGGGVEKLAATGVPLGIFEDGTWGCGAARLDPGDLLLLYTDGISEACSEQAAFFGEEGLLAAVGATLRAASPQRPSASEIQDTVLAKVRQFTGGAPPSDDIALVLLRRD